MYVKEHTTQNVIDKFETVCENYIQSLKLMCQFNLMKLLLQEKHTVLTSKS